ncbi:MAG TPA: glycosyltransferase 87 family protein [Candidatus Polarisedimenticolia bacterium]|nr:glycosyltransferase 87 family protein [Candidatus Polarisedimenticolia bacterium]
MRRWYLAASLAWCATALAVKPFFAYVDFGAFYSAALDKIVTGSPLDLYGIAARPPDSGLAIPLGNPPVWFFYLAPFYWLGRALGLADFHRQTGMSLGQAWMLLASLPLDLLLCRTVLRLAEGSRRIPEPGRLALYLCLLSSPLLWLSSIRFQHNEAAMVLMVLLAVAASERSRPTAAGVAWGLALGLKTTALVPALVWLGWGLRRGRLRATVITAAAGAAVFAGPLIPYAVFRREHLAYALLEFESLRPVGGYSLWKLFARSEGAASMSHVVILLLAFGTGLILARRPEKTFLAVGGAWGLVLGQVALLLLAKAIYIWYALGLSAFLYLAVARRQRPQAILPVVPLGAVLIVWGLQGGEWVGSAASWSVQVWSAVWAAFLLGIAAYAVAGLLGERQPDALSRP